MFRLILTKEDYVFCIFNVYTDYTGKLLDKYFIFDLNNVFMHSTQQCSIIVTFTYYVSGSLIKLNMKITAQLWICVNVRYFKPMLYLPLF